jgi:hypothetical protein
MGRASFRVLWNLLLSSVPPDARARRFPHVCDRVIALISSAQFSVTLRAQGQWHITWTGRNAGVLERAAPGAAEPTLLRLDKDASLPLQSNDRIRVVVHERLRLRFVLPRALSPSRSASRAVLAVGAPPRPDSLSTISPVPLDDGDAGRKRARSATSSAASSCASHPERSETDSPPALRARRDDPVR